MSLSIGLVGLPNVGKSTLFNAITKTAQAEAQNFPFCTIDPNTGVVPVPDSTLAKLAQVAESATQIPATISIIDIAGLVAGAHKGEGLGNAFLSHIRECSAIIQVIRAFTDEKIIHVNPNHTPKDDLDVINLELILADLTIAEKTVHRAKVSLKTGDKLAAARLSFYTKIYQTLENNQKIDSLSLTSEEELLLKELQLITAKPELYILNVSEEDCALSAEDVIKQSNLENSGLTAENSVVLSAKIEAEISLLPEDEQTDYMQMLGLTSSGQERLIQKSYSLLGLQSFYTAGPKEARAWTIKKGSTAVEAAGEIHTDFMKKFVKAEVCSVDDFLELNGWTGAKAKGKVRLEGKDYIMKPNDVVYFKIAA